MIFSNLELQNAIKICLSDDLRKNKFRGSANKFAGHCYVASEAMYHLSNKTMKVMVMRLPDGGTHWFLKSNFGAVVDLTSEQFSETPDYGRAKAIGFLTKNPSKRAKILIQKVLLYLS